MNIAEAFANKLRDLVADIDATEFNPVRCCVCVINDGDGKVEAVVRGYGVCAEHVLAMDQSRTVLEASRAIIAAPPQKQLGA